MGGLIGVAMDGLCAYACGWMVPVRAMRVDGLEFPSSAILLTHCLLTGIR